MSEQPTSWKQRVCIELDELTTRLTGLTKFIGSPAFRAVEPEHHRHLIVAQQRTMSEYQHILQMRLSADEAYQKSLVTSSPQEPAQD